VVWAGLIWLRIGTSGGPLWTRLWPFGFHKILGKSWIAALLAASQEGLSSMKLVENKTFIWIAQFHCVESNTVYCT
jgi:hypothetical protein